MVVARVILSLTGRTCNMFEIWHYIFQISFVYTVAAPSGYLAYSIVTFSCNRARAESMDGGECQN